MSEELFYESFQFGGYIVYAPHDKKDYAAYHVDDVKEGDTSESIKARGTSMGYIRRYAACSQLLPHV